MPANRWCIVVMVLAIMAATGCKSLDALPAETTGTRTSDPPGELAGFEEYYQEIREGAAAPGIIHGSGGCGCY